MTVKTPIDRKIPNNRVVPSGRKIPINRKIPNDRKIPNVRKIHKNFRFQGLPKNIHFLVCKNVYHLATLK
jgi:hypothetical protein